MRTAFPLLAVLLPAAVFAQSPAGDVAYLDGDVASLQCREGRPDQAIPVLERVLRGNGYTLPSRG